MEPIAVTILEACKASRSSRTTLYAAIGNGDLRAIKRGRKTLILMSDLRAWIEGLPEFKNTAATVGGAS